jgi:hypothetical protein
MWRPADGLGSRGARGGGQQGRARAVSDIQATRGEGGSRRWSGGGLHSGDGEVPCTGGRAGRVEQHVPEEEEGRGVQGAYLEISKISGSSR